MGRPVKRRAHWFVQVLPINPDMIDITNQYISEGVSGGIIKLILLPQSFQL